MIVEQILVTELIPYARNARTHSAEQVGQIARSILEFGFTNPILIDEGNGVIAGHGRLLAARDLGLDTLPCIRLVGLTEAQRRAYVIADNRLALDAAWDEELLALELGELLEDQFDLALTGFGEAEIAALLADDAPAQTEGEPGDGSDTADEVPEVPAVPVSRTGDLWALGDHRLLCGDATDPAVVATLMAGERARLCFTSPTYANQRSYTTGGIGDWDALMRGVFAHLPMSADAQVLVNLGLVHREGSVVLYWDDWLTWMPQQGWRLFGWYVWDQSVTVPGDWAGRLAPRHEFVFHFNREARKPNKIVPCKFAGQDVHLRPDGSSIGGLRAREGERIPWNHIGRVIQDFRIPDSVITVTRQRGAIGEGIDHPAVFPVGLPAFVIEAYTDPNDAVFEPFAGSGTSLLAAQRTGRRAYALEIAPEYVDVALKRFGQNYPEVPVTLVATGQTYDAVAEERLSALEAVA